MDFRFTAHDPQTGAFLHRLPRPEKVQIGDTFGTRGTLDLTFSSKALNAKTMPTFVEIRQEATFDNGMTWAQIGPNYLRLSGSHEDTDQAGMRTVKFVSRDWLLGKARVGEGDLPLIDGKRPFYQSSPGTIMRTLLLEAKDRGAAQGIEIGGFTGAKDSSGNSWGKVATIYYSPGLPILNVLENLVEQGLCDYRMDGNVMRLYEPETTMGRDHTTGGNPVRIHGNVTEAPVNYTLEDLTTSALLIGEDGFELEVDNPSAPDDYGRLEVTIEQGGVNQEGTARIMVDEALNKGSREIREITRTQQVDGLRFLPYRDYRVGDFVQVRDQGNWVRYRVREIQLVRDRDGWTAHTVINDRLQELLLKLAKRTSGIVNGSQGSGGDGTPPAPAPRPGIEPAAPEGLIIDQQVYLDRQGIARGVVTASWSAVTESVRDKAIDIGGYELWWRRNETYAEWTRAVVTTGDDTTVSHSPVVLSDVDGNAMAYQWKVRATAQESARPGPFSGTVTLTMTQDTTPPPAPSVPGVVTDLRIITVDWDGLDEASEQMPVDFNHVRVYFAATANMVGAEPVGYLTQAGSWNSGSMEPDVPVWVAISAVDNVGNESAMTDAQEVTPRKLVDDDSIRDAINGIDDAIDEAKQAAIDESVITAGGVTVHNKTTPPVDSPSDKEHDVWQQWTTLDEGGTLVAAWMHDGTSWVQRGIVEEYVPRINIAEGTFGTLAGGRLDAKSVRTDALLVGDFTNFVEDPEFNGPGWSGSIDYSFSYTSQGPGYALYYDGLDGGHVDNGNVFPVMPGDKIHLSARVQNRRTDWVQVHVAWFQHDRTPSGVSVSDGVTYDTTAPSFVWTDVSADVVAPSDARFGVFRINYHSGSGPSYLIRPVLRRMVGSTLIEDGAITTDKILANAITAGKIAALAIEADHISANAITADKIRAGAIDGKLITGARIRTAASGRRTELDVEGLTSYNASGQVVLTTNTSDGSIDMLGDLTQTRVGITLEVGRNYQGAGPGIQWSDSNIYAFPPGVVYSKDPDDTSKMRTLIQGPGVTDANSYLTLQERGNHFDLRTWKGLGSSRSDWRIQADLAGNLMRIGSSTNDAPYMYFKRGTGDTGAAFIGYRHPTNGGYASMALRDRYIWLGAYDSNGDVVSRLWGDADSTELTAGSRGLYLRGGSIHMPSLPNDSGATAIGRISGQLHSIYSSRRYKLLEESIESTVDEFESKLLSVDAKTWIDRTRAERIADYETAIAKGDEPTEDLTSCGGLERIPGVVAEDLHDAGLGVFVGYGEDGLPQSVLYDRIGPALIPIIRRLRDRVDALEQQLGATA